MNHELLKVLVVGSSGQVGTAFKKMFGQPHFSNLDVVFTNRKPVAKDVFIDLLDPTSISRTIQLEKPDIVINCAAYTAVDLAETERSAAYAINTNAVKTIAFEANALKAWLIHYSTDYVFNGLEERSAPWTEESRTGPINYYGETKLLSEEAVRSKVKNHLILRVQWVYGPDGKNFPRTILRVAKEREELSIVSDQVGAPTSADLIAKTSWDLLMLSLQNKANPGTYHLACRGETSWYNFAREVIDTAKKSGSNLKVERVNPIESKDYPTPAKRPLNSRLQLSKIEEALGYKMPSWQEEWASQSKQLIS